MKKNIFAVCDLEAEYAGNFMNYLNRKKNIPFEIQAFSNVKTLLEYAAQNHIELLLISSRAMCQEVQELGIGQIIILSEGMQVPELEHYPSVYKYQATADVVREVLACYGSEKAYLPAAFTAVKRSTEIIGVYSPISRCRKTSFALTLGQLLARERAVLYVNLESYSVLEELLNTTFTHTLSDLLYYIRQEVPNLTVRLNSMIRSFHGMDYIPSGQGPEDIAGTGFHEMERLLQEISLHTSYDTVILDIGEAIQDIFPLLDLCTRIYMPVLEDPISEKKLKLYEKLLKTSDFSQVFSKTQKLHLPFSLAQQNAEIYAEQLVFGELGMFVKELLSKEESYES